MVLENKRILFAFCSLELGGAERQGMHLARHLKRIGCDVHVLATHSELGLVAEQCDDAGIPWTVQRFHWPCRKISLLRDGWLLCRALRRLRPDVILSYTSWPNIGCGLVWRWTQAKVCVWGQRNTWQLRGDAIERIAYRRSSAAICNARHSAEYLRKTFGANSAPIHVVHNGLELLPAAQSGKEWRRNLKIDPGASVAAMVANFRPQKDHAGLLQGWRALLDRFNGSHPRPRLLLAGAPQQTFDAAQAQAARLGLDDSVLFLGQVRDIMGLLGASDLGVLCSKSEGLPNAILEYMANGLPVVASDLPGNREALGDDPLQILPASGDADSLAERMLSFLQSPRLSRDVGERNRLRAEQEFSLKSMCEKSVAILNDLLAQSERRRAAA